MSSFSRPTLAQLVARAREDLLSRLALDDPLRRSDAEAYALVNAGSAHGLYGYLAWIANQVIIDTAEAEFLERWAAIWGITRKPAAPATGTVSFTVLAGAVIPSGTLVQAFDGQQYATTTDAAGSVPTFTTPIQAVVAGAAGNRTIGQTLTLVSPIAGVQATATAGLLSGGADVEEDAALRTRLLTRIRKPPQGGDADDYVGWALEVPGVTRAWCYPLALGDGTVVVRFMRDNEIPSIPDAGEVATVQAYIDARRPVTAAVTVAAPIAAPIAFTIHLNPDTAAIRATVQAELSDLLLREAIPNGSILLSHIQEAISIAAGEVDHTLTVPATDVTNTGGNISTMGAISWV